MDTSIERYQPATPVVSSAPSGVTGEMAAMARIVAHLPPDVLRRYGRSHRLLADIVASTLDSAEIEVRARGGSLSPEATEVIVSLKGLQYGLDYGQRGTYAEQIVTQRDAAANILARWVLAAEA